MQVRFADVQADGLPRHRAGPQSLINSYVQKLAFDIKVPALPLKLVVQKVTALPDGPAVHGRRHGRVAQLERSVTPASIPDRGRALFRGLEPLVGSGRMSPLLTKRRAVDLCRMAACLCRPVI